MKAHTLALLLCVLLANAHAIALQDKIKHVIILMEENRSYDHLLGFYLPGVIL